MVQGNPKPAPGISESSAGGLRRTFIHMNRHYCHYQLMGSQFDRTSQTKTGPPKLWTSSAILLSINQEAIFILLSS